MKCVSARLVLLAWLVCAAPGYAQKAAQHTRFLEGLRERGYFKYAELYLDQLQKQAGVPTEIRQSLDYERAVILLEAGRAAASPQEKNELYELAIKRLDQFVKNNPGHKLVGDANAQRGRIKLNKARVEIWQSQSPSNKAKKGAFQTAGRKLVQEARVILQAAHDQYQATWKAFPTFLDKVKDRQRFEERKRAEAVYMRAQYDLALCTYEDAQTWDRDSKNYKKLLTDASTQFETIHTRYRSQVLGLYARMWQGKSFEEQDDINKAMGIYNELLGHPGTSDTMRRIQDKVLLFKLICLNHEAKKDYQLVIAESDSWLRKRRPTQRRLPDALGVLWEQVRARELLAGQRATSKAAKDDLLTKALTSCRFIQRWPGKYKDVALFKMRDLQLKLKGRAADPQDFDSAFGIAHDMFKKIKDHNDALTVARREKKPAAEIKKIGAARAEHLSATADMLNRALLLVDRTTARDDRNRARFYLAFVYYQQRRNYEAAVLADYLSRHAGKENDMMALDAAAITMASHVRSYNDSRTAELKQVDLRLIEKTAKRILETWPESSRAQDTRMQLAQVYEGKRPLDAAQQYAQINKDSRDFAKAQMRAGQQFLRAWLDATASPVNSRPPAAELEGWLKSSAEHLKRGIAGTEKVTPAEAAAPELLVAAKVSLARILNGQGQYQLAADLLLNKPHGVIDEIATTDEAQRPETGVKSREFASEAAQLLLRSRIGLKQLEEAQTAMERLEKIAGAARGEAVTQLYQQLGKELKQELARLESTGDQDRVAEVQTSFEGFLERLRQRQQQTFNSLIWIAETYAGLGLGASKNPAKAAEYFGHAASSYKRILDLGSTNPKFLSDPKMIPGVKLRLVNCRTQQGQFDEARALVVELLKASPMALDVQFEAAALYQAWAKSGQPANFEKAIVGVKTENVMGWSQISLTLQRLIDSGSKDASQYRARRYEARYNQLQCRLLYAAADSTKKDEQLKRARLEIQSMMTVVDEIDSAWDARYNDAYTQILNGLGEPVITLAEYREQYQPKAVVTVPVVAGAVGTTGVTGSQDKASGDKTSASESEGPGLLGLIFAGLVVLGGGVGVVFMIKGTSRSSGTRRRYSPKTAPVPVSRKRDRSAGKSERRPRSASRRRSDAGPVSDSAPRKRRSRE